MHSRLITFIFLLLPLLLTGCETTYYNTMEKVGIHKRDILINRIEDTQDAQKDAQKQFKSAMEQLKSIADFDGGDLESVYNKLNSEYEDSEASAELIHKRIEKVESVAKALFKEWKTELNQYSNTKLKRDSARKLNATQKRYNTLVVALRRSEKSITPVLNTLRDNTFYLKHNLNAQAVISLKGEFKYINADINKLIQEMQKSITESNTFITELRRG